MSMTRADAHIHLYTDGWRAANSTVELRQFNELRTLHGIAAALVVATDRANNAHLQELSALNHRWLVPLANCDALRPPSVGEVERLRNDGFAGVTLNLKSAADGRALATWPREVVRVLDRQRAVLSLTSAPSATAEIGPFCAGLDGAHVLISHLGLPGRFTTAPSGAAFRRILEPVLNLAQYPSVGVKHSGGYVLGHPMPRAVHNALVVALEAYGADRLYWGSDFPNVTGTISFSDALDLHAGDLLTADETASVVGGNLMRVLAHHSSGAN